MWIAAQRRGLARRNADLSGLAAAPIRWIVEDAARFVSRELHRGNRYDAVILDPPSYGHGPAGESWKLEGDLAPLLANCAARTARRPRRFILLTCHTPNVTPRAAEEMIRRAIAEIADRGPASHQVVGDLLGVRSSDGRALPCGVSAWSDSIGTA